MSYQTEQYNTSNDALVDQQLAQAGFDGNNNGDIFRSFLGLANQIMSDMIRNGPNTDGISSFPSTDSSHPGVKVFGISSTNVTQISHGPDGRSHIVQAHDERRMGPGGVWQTKKTLRDPDHGIDKMQLGYFIGDRGEILERQLDSTSGQYRQEIKRRGIPPNEKNFSNQWKIQAQQATQRPPRVLSQQALPTSSYYQ